MKILARVSLLTLLISCQSALGSDAILERLDTLEGRVMRLEDQLKMYRDKDSRSALISPNESELAERESFIPIEIQNKQFIDLKYENAITWDAIYSGEKLEKTARAVKGVLVFADLFEESKFEIRITLSEPLGPKESLFSDGVGFKYNQFKDSHDWVKNTKLKNMTYWFRVDEVLYEDGTKQKFTE